MRARSSDGLCRSGLALALPKGRAGEPGGAGTQHGNVADTSEACLHFKAVWDNTGCEPKAQILPTQKNSKIGVPSSASA